MKNREWLEKQTGLVSENHVPTKLSMRLTSNADWDKFKLAQKNPINLKKRNLDMKRQKVVDPIVTLPQKSVKVQSVLTHDFSTYQPPDIQVPLNPLNKEVETVLDKQYSKQKGYFSCFIDKSHAEAKLRNAKQQLPLVEHNIELKKLRKDVEKYEKAEEEREEAKKSVSLVSLNMDDGAVNLKLKRKQRKFYKSVADGKTMGQPNSIIGSQTRYEERPEQAPSNEMANTMYGYNTYNTLNHFQTQKTPWYNKDLK